MNSALAEPQPTILLVDDDSFMLDLQTRMLRDMGYCNVVSAGNAALSLERLLGGEADPDIIICDLNMPGMDGLEFLQILSRRAFAGSVILLSGEGARIMHTVKKLLTGGRMTILGALEKPGRPDAIRALMNQWKPASETSTTRHVGPPLTVGEVQAAVERGHLLLHYQPKIELRTGALTGVEALVRMQHPTRGIVYPDSFINIAAQCEAIDHLTDWVLRAAVAQLALWIADGIVTQVAVNVSMDNLSAQDFASRATRVVRDAGTTPAGITFEVTESRAMSPSMAPLETLVRLRLARFKLSIDDFGTGHSSLAQLRDVPFSELKVDRSFVHGAHSNQIIRPMLEGSIGLAKRLGMVAVAEGVETLEDLNLLREIDCDVAQGYFIGRPMDSQALPAWKDEWEGRRSMLFAS